MKIGILTHYDVNNQGAQLQLYALYMQLKSLGHDPIVLTYRKNYDFDPSKEKRNQITISSIPYILKNFLFEKGIELTWHNVKKYVINKKFREKEFRYGSYCLTEMGAAIVGADEVFSLELGVNIMMYGHGVNTENMIAYAPSIGQTDLARIDRYHCRNLISSGLKDFHSLSARDKHTQNIVETLTGRQAGIVCDPVLLYEFPLNDFKLPKGTPTKDYMVVYSYDARFILPEEIKAITAYAKAHGLETVSVGTYHAWCDVNIACNALEWLKCIQGAKAILYNVTGGPNLGLMQISEASEIISGAAHEDANIIFGTAIDETLEDTVRITVIATGFDEDGAEDVPEFPSLPKQPSNESEFGDFPDLPRWMRK